MTRTTLFFGVGWFVVTLLALLLVGCAPGPLPEATAPEPFTSFVGEWWTNASDGDVQEGTLDLYPDATFAWGPVHSSPWSATMTAPPATYDLWVGNQEQAVSVWSCGQAQYCWDFDGSRWYGPHPFP